MSLQTRYRFLDSAKMALATAVLFAPLSASGAEEQVDSIEAFMRLVRWDGLVNSLFVLGASWVVLRFIHGFARRIGEKLPRYRLMVQKFETILQFVVYISTGVIVLFLSFNLDKTTLTLIGGTAAVALGFALKDILASFIAGLVIMIDRPFQVGDRVTFDGQYGDIVAIGMRSVQMVTLDDSTVTIPNNKFINDVTTSANFGELDMQVVMPFYIGVDQDIAKATQILREAALSCHFVYQPKPIAVLARQVIHESYIAVELKLKVYVLDTKYEKEMETDLYTRAMGAMLESGIQPPAVLHRNIGLKAPIDEGN